MVYLTPVRPNLLVRIAFQARNMIIYSCALRAKLKTAGPRRLKLRFKSRSRHIELMFQRVHLGLASCSRGFDRGPPAWSGMLARGPGARPARLSSGAGLACRHSLPIRERGWEWLRIGPRRARRCDDTAKDAGLISGGWRVCRVVGDERTTCSAHLPRARPVTITAPSMSAATSSPSRRSSSRAGGCGRTTTQSPSAMAAPIMESPTTLSTTRGSSSPTSSLGSRKTSFMCWSGSIGPPGVIRPTTGA